MNNQEIIKCCNDYPLIDRHQGMYLMECSHCKKTSGTKMTDAEMRTAFAAATPPPKTATK